MSACTFKFNGLQICTMILLGTLLGLSACADRASLREKELARYDVLENELISTQEEDERRRRVEYRVAQKLQQIQAESATATRATQSTVINFSSTGSEDTEDNGSHPSLIQPTVPVPALDQAVVDLNSGRWRLQNFPSPTDGMPICAVVSIPEVVRNGTLDTSVRIIVSNSAVYLRTDATFDVNELETGYRIDAGFPFSFDNFLNELTAVIDDNHARLVQAMQAGTTLSVEFAYDPQISSETTYVMDLALDTFNQAWSKMDECNADKSGDTLE